MMLCKKTGLLSSVFLFACFCWLGSALAPTAFAQKRYRFEEGSRLYIKGASNVNTFICDCTDQHIEQTLDAEHSGNHAQFRNTTLSLRLKTFDCHNSKIDSDMQKALKAAQYPYIKIELADAWQNAKCLNGGCNDWFDVRARVKITITNVVKEEFVAAKAQMLGPNRFQLVGEKALQMSAYGISPPETMFGLIKVNDWISFHFDLLVRVDDVQ